MSPAQRLEDNVALVTGGGNGIGRGIVRRFAEEGARVAIGDIDIEAAHELAGQIGETALAIELDVSRADAFSAAIDAAISRWGRLDILVNNAGIVVPIKPVQTTTEEEFFRLVNINLRGTYLGCRLAYPFLRETRGCVLNISSLVGIAGEIDHAIYGATKGAINALTICTAADWRRDGIRINALCPGDVWTDALDGWCRSQPTETYQFYQKMREQGRCADPAQIGAVAAFLCSSDAAFINGAVIPASGGAECGYRLAD